MEHSPLSPSIIIHRSHCRSTCRECLVCINLNEVRLSVMIEPDGLEESKVRVSVAAWFHKKCFVQAVANYSTTSSLLMPSNPTAFSLVTLQSSCFEGIAKFAADEVKVVPCLLAPRLCFFLIDQIT